MDPHTCKNWLTSNACRLYRRRLRRTRELLHKSSQQSKNILVKNYGPTLESRLVGRQNEKLGLLSCFVHWPPLQRGNSGHDPYHPTHLILEHWDLHHHSTFLTTTSINSKSPTSTRPPSSRSPPQPPPPPPPPPQTTIHYEPRVKSFTRQTAHDCSKLPLRSPYSTLHGGSHLLALTLWHFLTTVRFSVIPLSVLPSRQS